MRREKVGQPIDVVRTLRCSKYSVSLKVEKIKVVRTPSMLTMSPALDIPHTIVSEMNFFSASDDEILPFDIQIEEFFNESWS
jgi:hypothetical protein